MATYDIPATLERTLARDPAPVSDEIMIAVRLSRANLERLRASGGLPCVRVALQADPAEANTESLTLVREPDSLVSEPVEGVYRMAAEGGRDFRDQLPVRR